MVGYDENIYAKLAKEFNREIARVEPYVNRRRKLTKNLDKRKEYKESLIRTFNNIANFFSTALRTAKLEDRLGIQTITVEHLIKLKEAFHILRLKYEFPKVIYESIDINKVDQDWTDLDGLSEEEDDDKSTDSSSQDKHLDSNNTKSSAQSETETKQTETKQTETSQTASSTLDNSAQSNSSQSNVKTNQTNMTQTPEDFMAIAHRTISFKYSGDPLALESFIDAISLLTTLCKPESVVICVQFIMTKLEGVAREAS